MLAAKTYGKGLKCFARMHVHQRVLGNRGGANRFFRGVDLRFVNLMLGSEEPVVLDERERRRVAREHGQHGVLGVGTTKAG